MKYYIILFFLIVVFSCGTQSTKYKSNQNYESLATEKSAADEILNRINFIEEQYYERYKKGKPYDFNLVNDIVNLSGIASKKWDGNWSGLTYTPDEEDISKWKDWYRENKNEFYYNDNHRAVRFYNNRELKFDRRLIFLKTKSGEVKSSFSDGDMQMIYGAMYKYENSLLKDSKNPADKILYNIMSLRENDGNVANEVVINNLKKISKITTYNTSEDAYSFLSWFNKYENYIYYEGDKVAIRYPSGEKIVLD